MKIGKRDWGEGGCHQLKAVAMSRADYLLDVWWGEGGSATGVKKRESKGPSNRTGPNVN